MSDHEKPALAHMEHDPRAFRPRLALRTRGRIVHWGDLTAVEIAEATGAAMDDSAWLSLEDDEWRAIYDALTDWFGHAGHDTRALRKDYDAERKRVDTMMAALIAGPRVILTHGTDR